MLARYLDVFSAYLDDHPFAKDPRTLYEPLDYILSLGGKRIRPALTLMTTDMMGGDMAAALPAAFAVEVFHNFSLMHDDIMDQAPLRRGQQTVHQLYDVNTAILSGDAMLIKAYEALMGYPDHIAMALLRGFSETSLAVCEGQQLDMDFETRGDVDIAAYIHMITGKTSVLLAEAMRMGAIVAGADKHLVRHAYGYGLNAGIAFQIQDDILDTYGEHAKVGKQIGGDILQGKKTYLYLKAIELATPEQQALLRGLYADRELADGEKIDAVVKIFDSLHVRLYAEEVKGAYRDLAHSHLDEISVADERKQTLRQLTQYLLDRDQ